MVILLARLGPKVRRAALTKCPSTGKFLAEWGALFDLVRRNLIKFPHIIEHVF
jgi:hypothetical protein